MAYTIAFAQSVREQLLTLTARERTRGLDAIEEQLSHQSLVETKHRKALRPNPIAPWELRAAISECSMTWLPMNPIRSGFWR